MITNIHYFCSRRSDDAYSILGIRPDATIQEIKKRFQQLTIQHHPDRDPNNKFHNEQYAKITQAYSLLSDEKKRQEYDLMRQTKPKRIDYLSKNKYIIDVGTCTNIPKSLQSTLDASQVTLLPPFFSGITGFILTSQPFVESLLRRSPSWFDTLSIVAYNFIGWIIKPKIGKGNHGHIIGNVLKEDLIINEKECRCGNELIMKINKENCFEGMIEGKVEEKEGLMIDSNVIKLKNEKNYDIINWKKIKLGIVDINLLREDGFLIGCMYCLKLFGFKWFKSFFNTIDQNKVIASLTSILKKEK